MIALENGQVQAWSDHPAGGLQGSFQGIHTAGDYVSAFATDVDNDYLFTGTTVGYIKIWLMTNYLRNEDVICIYFKFLTRSLVFYNFKIHYHVSQVHVNMPKLRLTFPFLWRDRIEGRAKRSVRDQPLPLLLSSYRGHLRCITSIAYVDDLQLVLRSPIDDVKFPHKCKITKWLITFYLTVARQTTASACGSYRVSICRRSAASYRGASRSLVFRQMSRKSPVSRRLRYRVNICRSHIS